MRPHQLLLQPWFESSLSGAVDSSPSPSSTTPVLGGTGRQKDLPEIKPQTVSLGLPLLACCSPLLTNTLYVFLSALLPREDRLLLASPLRPRVQPASLSSSGLPVLPKNAPPRQELCVPDGGSLTPSTYFFLKIIIITVKHT